MKHGTFVLVVVMGVAICAAVAKDDGGTASDNGGSIVIVRPPSVFGSESGRVLVDGKGGVQRTGAESFALGIEPGTYAIYSDQSSKPKATLKVEGGRALYLVDRTDAAALWQFAGILQDKGSPKSALVLYRDAIKLDPTVTRSYKRYAELAAELGHGKEALAALKKVISASLADEHTYRALGDVHFGAKRYADAAGMYEKALDEGGEDAGVLGALGNAKLRMGDILGAARACERAIRLEPDSAKHFRSLGDVYLKEGDTAKAAEPYKTFLEKGGKSSAVTRTLGAYEFGRRRFEDAVKYLSMVSGKTASQFDVLSMLGESHFRLGEYKKAFPALRTAANKYTRHARWPEVAEMLIESYVALKQNKKAKFWVDKYAKVAKRQSDGVAYFRAYLLERSSSDRARAQYEKNIVKYPGDHRNYLRLGLLESKRKKSLARSLTLLKKAVSLADTIPEAWLEIARVYRQLGRPEDELSALQVFVASEPQHPEANARIGELMLSKGKTGEALRRLEVASKGGGSDDPRVLLALAQGYANSGRNEEAIAALEKAKRLSPDNIVIRQKLAMLYERTGDTKKVLSEIKESLEIQRDNPTLLMYARRLYQAGKYRDAEDAIEDIRATDPEDIGALMFLGTVYRAQKKYEDAVEIYEEIVAIDPSYVTALYERAETHREADQPHWAETFYKRTLSYDSKFALAELGLAKVAKLRGDQSGYRAHLSRARKLEPNNALVQKEYSSGGGR